MIESATGDLLRSDVDALVNTVNCVGVMGKGLALQFKQAFPAMFRAYERAAKAGDVIPGRMNVFDLGAGKKPRYIINFPTKRHWKGKSLIEDIDSGLIDLVRRVHELGIQAIAVPPLGAGNGGLDWALVRPKIAHAFAALPDVRLLLFEPVGEPPAKDRLIGTPRPPLTTARALFLRLMEAYRIPDYDLTLLEVQKLAWFLQEAGQPLRLNFEKAAYGPYAHNLNHVLRHLEGHYLHGATDTKPGTLIRLADGAGAEAQAFLQDDAQALAHLHRVAQLIEGFETPYGLEVLATVHWTAKEHEGARRDADECVRAVHRWSERKAQTLRADHIQIARRRLIEEGFLA